MCIAVLTASAAQPGWAEDAPTQRDLSKEKQCRQAYRDQDLSFVLKHCPEEAWALARAQCEREPEKVKPAYVDFCNRFYTGAAPTYGR